MTSDTTTNTSTDDSSVPPPFWEQGYSDMTVSTMGGPNHDIVELVDALPDGARVLDLGCGEGRNSLFLAGHGHRVKAVDISAAGIAKLAAIASASGFELDTEVADLNGYEIAGDWDVVLAHGVIDYLDNAEWRRLVTEIKSHTRPGGFNAYTCMLFTEDYPAPPEFQKACFKHSLAPYELVGTYDDWETIRHDRYVKWDQHPGIPLHCHPVDKVVARRPGGAGPPVRIVPVPVGPVDLDRDRFDAVEMGIDAAELLRRCGEPDVVDRFTMDGIQLGVGPHITYDGYDLSLWYYGTVLMYVVNDRVWGRALCQSPPVRVDFAATDDGPAPERPPSD